MASLPIWGSIQRTFATIPSRWTTSNKLWCQRQLKNNNLGCPLQTQRHLLPAKGLDSTRTARHPACGISSAKQSSGPRKSTNHSSSQFQAQRLTQSSKPAGRAQPSKDPFHSVTRIWRQLKCSRRSRRGPQHLPGRGWSLLHP